MAKKAALSDSTKMVVLESFKLLQAEAQQELDDVLAERTAEYEKDLKRRKEEDEYNFNKEKRARTDKLEQEIAVRESTISVREANVEAREINADLNDRYNEELEAKVSKFPEELELAQAKGYNKGLIESKRQYETDLRVKEAEYLADVKVLDSKLNSANATISDMQATIISLRNELTEANKRVQAVADSGFKAAGEAKVTVNQSAPNGR